jgi:hypothetical protein
MAASADVVSTWARRSVVVARLPPATTPANKAGRNFTERIDIRIPGTQRNATNATRLYTSPIWLETWVAMSRNSGSYEVKFRPVGRLNWGGCKCKENQRKAAGLTVLSGYHLEAFQRPVEPSDRTKEPGPLWPAKRKAARHGDVTHGRSYRPLYCCSVSRKWLEMPRAR